MLKTIAKRVDLSYKQKNQLKDLSSSELKKVFFDPASIALYASIIVEIIKLARKCKKEKDIPTSAKNPNIFERIMVKRIIRKKMGFKKYFKHGKEVTNAILETGSAITQDEIHRLCKEI